MMQKKTFNVLYDDKKGFYFKPARTTSHKDGAPVAIGSYSDCKKQADILNLQLEKF